VDVEELVEQSLKMRNVAICVGFAVGLLTGSAIAEDHATYQSLWAQVSANPDCKPADHADFTLVTCANETTFWYFTKSNHPAHPSVIKRVIQKRPDGSWMAHEDGHRFGPDSAQPAFKTWLEQIHDLDHK
jgi:hypothetical protein